MIFRSKTIIALLSVQLIFLSCYSSLGQVKADDQIEKIAKQVSGQVGVYALDIETGESVSYQGDKKFPMQSVYKFPIGMAVLDRVDKGELSLNREVRVDTSAYIPASGHSPLRDAYPDGTIVTVQELLRYSTVESDGSASDVLLCLLGGVARAQEYLRGLGVYDMAIATTEKAQVANDTIQYQNWATPEAMSRLFAMFYQGNHLSPHSRELLMRYLSPSSSWFNKRIKGLLPKGTPVIHKTGTSGTIDGLTGATNDAGIITLPNGRHIAVSVFISDSYAPQKDREMAIARISKCLYDHFITAGR